MKLNRLTIRPFIIGRKSISIGHTHTVFRGKFSSGTRINGNDFHCRC